MRDKDLLPLLRTEDFARRLDERWVSPYLVDTIDEFSKSRIPYWNGRPLRTINDRLIAETADAFFGAWRAAL
jgi:hypothetical protein